MELDETIEFAPGFVQDPDYKIVFEDADREIVATLQGEVIAKSENAVILRESRHLPVVYFPPRDVRRDLAHPSEKETFCPFKGHASYWSFGTEKNIAWSYENPYQEMQEIKGYLAFYTDRLDAPLLG